MSETEVNITFLVLVVGGLVTLVILLRAGLVHLGLPALVGYIGVGFVLRVLDMKYGLFSEQGMEIFDFLAKIGVIVLLFRIGLESNLTGLLHQLRRASGVWCADVVCNMGLGYVVSSVLLGLGVIPSLFIATVMQRGLHEEDWAVSPQIYAAMVMISAATCLFSPIIIRLLLQKWPQTPEEKGGKL